MSDADAWRPGNETEPLVTEIEQVPGCLVGAVVDIGGDRGYGGVRQFPAERHDGNPLLGKRNDTLVACPSVRSCKDQPGHLACHQRIDRVYLPVGVVIGDGHVHHVACIVGNAMHRLGNLGNERVADVGHQ